MPANWAMPVWLSLILCGAKAGGLRETATLHFESQRAAELLPDSRAGILQCNDVMKDCENSYFRKPPNKRVNFIKYGVPTPFHCPWQSLVDEWSSLKSNNPYFVFRNRAELRKARAYIDNCASVRKQQLSTPSLNLSFAPGSLVAVHLSLVSAGALTSFSHICLPTEADLRRRLVDKSFLGPCETPHHDVYRKRRRWLRQEHAKLLKRLRRKRIKEKMLKVASGGPPARLIKRKVSPTALVVAEYQRASRQLWLPHTLPDELRQHCDRQICGFVTTSGFSYMRARTTAIGYITSESLYLLLELHRRVDCQPMLLTRAPNSLAYRFSTVNVSL